MSQSITTQEAEDILSSDVCRCARSKSKGHSLCGRCYIKLPMALNHGITQRVGAGFEDAYIAACEYLNKQDAIEVARNPQANLFE